MSISHFGEAKHEMDTVDQCVYYMFYCTGSGKRGTLNLQISNVVSLSSLVISKLLDLS